MTDYEPIDYEPIDYEPIDYEPIEGGPWLDDQSPTTAAWALFFAIFLLMAGNGLQGSLIGVRTEAEGFSVAVAGVIMAAYFAGFLAGTRYAEYLLARVGHIRVFAGLASMASTAVLVHALFINAYTWGAMRFVTGVCMAGLYVVAESWLNDLATNATRGRLLSVYMVATMGGMASGQFLLDLAEPGGFELFMLSSVLVSASLVPVALSASSNPPLGVPDSLSLRELARRVPGGVYSAFWGGASMGVLIALGAVYAVAVDVPDSRLPAFLAAPLIGSVVLQWPIGRLSDSVPRGNVMVSVAAAASGICVALTLVDPRSWTTVGLMFALGGTSFPLYSLTIAYTADQLPSSQLTAGSAALVRINGIGALAGPLGASAVMAVTNEVAFFWAMAATHGVIVPYLLYRMVVAETVSVDDQSKFIAFPARASAAATSLLGRHRKPPSVHRE